MRWYKGENMRRKTKIIISFILFVLGVFIFSVQTKAMDAYEIYEKAVQNTIQSGSWTEHTTEVIDINYTEGNTQGEEKGNVIEYSLNISNYSRENPRDAIISGHGKVNVLEEKFNFEYQYENGISHTIIDSGEYEDNPQEEPALFNFDIFTQDMFENASIYNTEIKLNIPANKVNEILFKDSSTYFEEIGYGDVILDYGDATVEIIVDEKNVSKIILQVQGIFNKDDTHVVADYKINYDFLKSDSSHFEIKNNNVPADAVEFNGHYYYIYNSDMANDWNNAQVYCEKKGGYLATITSREEDSFVFSYLVDSGYGSALFGLSDQDELDNWKWVTGEAYSYQNWESGEPNHQGGNEHYGMYYDGFTDGKWNDGDGVNVPFICEWDKYEADSEIEEEIELRNRLAVYSDYDNLSVRKGSSITLGACLIEDGEITEDVSGITFVIENPSILEISDTGISSGKRYVKLTGKGEGTTVVTFSDSKTGSITKVPVTVYNNNYLSYTISSVPVQNIEKYPTNIYNANGLYMDNYSYIVNADKSATVSFDIYNTNYTYGVVEVYKKDGKLQNCVLIEKMEKNNTSIKKAVWDNSKCLISDLVNGNLLTYRQESMYSKKTSITVDIPEGGYIKISNDSSTSLVAIINDVDMLISIGKLKKTIEGNGVENEEFLKQLTGKILREKTYAAIIENKDEITKKLWKNVSEKVYYSTRSLGSFSQTIANNLSELNLGEVISETASDFGWNIGEKVFEYFSGPIGDILKGLFQLGSLENIIIQHVEYVNSYNAGSIFIQNQGGGIRTLQQVTVESEKGFSDDTSLNVFKIDLSSDALNILKTTSPEIYNKIQSGISYTYNISLMKDGREVQPDEKVSVYIPIPKELKLLAYMKQAKIYRLENDGSLTEMDTKLKNDCFEFETTHFSVYILTENVYSKEKNTVLISVLIFIICILIICCIFIFKCMKKRKCSTCGAVIKTKGRFCTRCGAPIYNEKKSKKKIIILSILLFILMSILIYYIYFILFESIQKNKLKDTIESNLDKNESIDLQIDDIQKDMVSTQEDQEKISDSEKDFSDRQSDSSQPAIENNNIPADAVEFNGHHYYIYDSDMANGWNNAQGYCEMKGGYLATITSKEEDSFVYSYLINSGYGSALFGLSDQDETDNWKWVTGEKYSYQNWESGEPNHLGGNEHYGMYYEGFTNGKWNDGDGVDVPFICEWGEYNTDSETEEEQKSIEEKVAYIRSVYQDIVSAMQNTQYKEIEFTKAARSYSDGMNIRCIVMPKQSDDELYNKYYYFDNNHLIFAYYEGLDSHRFYFDHDQLIRWRYASEAKNPDSAVNYEDKTDEFIDWQERVYADVSKIKQIMDQLNETGYIFPDINSRKLDITELTVFTSEQLNLIKNEIYARHGYNFNNDEIREYFLQFSWYEPSIAPEDFEDSLFNDYEIYNRNLILNYKEG